MRISRVLLPLAVASGAAAQQIVYVDRAAVGPAHDGQSWCTAFARIHEALAAATPGAETIVRIADGTYIPDPTGLADPREATFRLLDDLAIEGGYAGCGALDPDERAPLVHRTILSGDLNGDDPPGAPAGENCYHVLTALEVGATAILDGVYVTGGHARGSLTGGGIYIELAAPTIRNCVFMGNTAYAGGALSNIMGSPSLANCVLIGNRVANDGGAIFNDLSSLTLVNCTVAGNTALIAAGIRNYAGVELLLTNCILWDNAADGRTDEEAQIVNTASGTSPDYCCIQGWTGAFGGTGNTGENPRFVDADGADDTYGTSDDDPRLLPGSPCIDAGTPEEAPDTDIGGAPRPCVGEPDIGAFEHCDAPPPSRFSRGDANADGELDVADAVFTLVHLFGQGVAPECADAADSNDDGTLDIADSISFLSYLFASAEPPPPPFPGCGLDETEDGLGCRAFAPCAPST